VLCAVSTAIREGHGQVSRFVKQAGLFPGAVQHVLKRAPCRPHAVAFGIDIDEESQDAIAICRATGAGIDVYEFIARMRLQIPALLLDEPEAAGADARVIREVSRHMP
jgi:hypothetical protein